MGMKGRLPTEYRRGGGEGGGGLYKNIQSKLDYPDPDYPDYSIIRTFFSGPNFSMNIN